MRKVRDKAFAEFLGRCRGAVSVFDAEFAGTGDAASSGNSVVLLYRILALLRSESQAAAEWRILLHAPDHMRVSTFQDACNAVYQATGLPLFSDRYQILVSEEELRSGLSALFNGESAAGSQDVYFSTVPIGWFGRAYQALMGRADRKKAGVYFTPDYLIRYVVDSSIEAYLDAAGGQRLLFETPLTVEDIRILDPSVGSGDFLIQSVESLTSRWVQAGDSGASSDDGNVSFRASAARRMEAREKIAKQCVYGLDLDPIAVEVSRTSLALLVGLDRGPFDSLERNIRVGNTLLEQVQGFDAGKGNIWPQCFHEVFGEHRERPGFDIILGNPPYIAAKNGELVDYSDKPFKTGQSDSYLMFVKHIADSHLLRDSGVFSMVLPDPVLIRGNAREVREILFSKWTPLSLLHVAGAFSDAVVANAVPLCRKSRSNVNKFSAARIDYLSDRHAFASAPDEVFQRKSSTVDLNLVNMQPGREVLYLADEEFRKNVMSRIHGDSGRLTDYREPFVPLSSLDVDKIFRGEEVGKAAVSGSDGTYPMLLGGQSIARYHIKWAGTRTSNVKKQLDWYIGRKIVIQKSAAKIVAALDDGREEGGFVVPQSVYCIKPGRVAPFYLLSILNSRLMGDYVFRLFTGYKMLQPQLELEDIKRLPIRSIERRIPENECQALVEEGQVLITQALRDGRLDEESLVSFVEQRLNRVYTQEEVLHDLLVRLGKGMTALASEDPTDDDDEVFHRQKLTAGQKAIDIIVCRLYGVPLSYMLHCNTM